MGVGSLVVVSGGGIPLIYVSHCFLLHFTRHLPCASTEKRLWRGIRIRRIFRGGTNGPVVVGQDQVVVVNSVGVNVVIGRGVRGQ